MRVTEKAIFDAASRSTGSARTRLEQATGEMSTGLRAGHPGDDPAAAAMATRLGAQHSAFDSRAKALEAAGVELDATDSALSAITDSLRRAQELSIQLGNDTYSAADRAAAATEVDGLLQGIIGQLNTRVGDRYVFGGTKDGAEPFSAAGAYSGAGDSRFVEIFPGIQQLASVRADVALKGVGGGTDVLASLQQLATDLRSNNGGGVRSAAAALETGMDQVLSARTQIGSSSQVVQMAASAATAARDDVGRQRARVTEVDPFEAASNLARAQHALDAALTASAKSFQLSLLDKLR